MNFRIDFLGALEDLVDVQVLFGRVHDLEDDAALAGEADTTLAEGGLEVAGRIGGVDTFAARDAPGWGCRHCYDSLRVILAGTERDRNHGTRGAARWLYRSSSSDFWCFCSHRQPSHIGRNDSLLGGRRDTVIGHRRKSLPG